MPASNFNFPDAELQAAEEGLAIVCDGNTAPMAIASGKYLFIKNHSTLATGGYHATAAIASGETLSSSNVAADASGIANAIADKIGNLKYVVQDGGSSTKTMAQWLSYMKQNNYRYLYINSSSQISDYPSAISAYPYYIIIEIITYGAVAFFTIRACKNDGATAVLFGNNTNGVFYCGNAIT